MPVLHSCWLEIHVTVIGTGYAPVVLPAILALMVLVVMIFRPDLPTDSWQITHRELSIVHEMAIMIGLFLFTTGTFPGGLGLMKVRSTTGRKTARKPGR